MLSFHGLVIICTDNSTYTVKDWGAFVNTEVIVSTADHTVSKYLLEIIVYLKNLDELKSKLTKGTVCDISHGDIVEYKSKFDKETIYYNRIRFRVHFDDIKFLKIPMYYETVADKLVFETKGETDVT